MKLCTKCGANIDENTKFCPDCGAAAETVTSPDTEAAPAAEKTDFSEKISQLNNTADTTADYDAADIEKNKIMAVLAIIGIINALNGRTKELPIIGKFKILK